MGLLFAVYIGVNLVSGQTVNAAADSNPIGKVLVATGTIRIEHPAAVTVQANLPTNNVGQAKVGDFIYRGDIIQTGPDGKLGVGFTDGSSFSVSPNARMEVNEFVYDPHGHFNSSLMSTHERYIYFHCWRGRSNWQHESYDASWHNGHSRHRSSRRNLERRFG